MSAYFCSSVLRNHYSPFFIFGRGVQPGGDVAIIPSNLLYAVWNFVDYMAGYTQQDAHEFLIAFLNSIDCQLRRDSEYASPDEFSKVNTR